MVCSTLVVWNNYGSYLSSPHDQQQIPYLSLSAVMALDLGRSGSPRCGCNTTWDWECSRCFTCYFHGRHSAASAELIAVSSIVTFDVIGLWKPLHGRQAVTVWHCVIAIFAVWAGAWSTILHYAHLDLGWLFYVQGVLLTPAVMPIAFTVIWKKQSANGAFFGKLFGGICGLFGWFCTSIGRWKLTNELDATKFTELSLSPTWHCRTRPYVDRRLV